MRAEVNQDGLDSGYARVVIWLDETDQPYARGDSIAIGRPVGNNNWEYIARAGGGRKSGVPEPLKMAAEPVAAGREITFMLTPFYVDSIDDGNYSIAHITRDGKVKNMAVSVPVQVNWSGLDDVGTLRDYNEDEAQAGKSEPGTPAHVPYSEMERDLRREEAIAQIGLAQAEMEPPQATDKTADKADDNVPQPEPGTPENIPYSEMEQDLRKEEADAQIGLADAEMQPQASKSKGMMYAGLLILLLALCAGGWYYWQNQKAFENEQMALQAEEARRQAEEEARKAAAEEEARQAAAAEAEAKKAAEEAARAARANAKGRVAEFFAGKRDPKAAMDLAADLDADTPEQQDAIFRLYYYAAGQDYPAGAESYARCLDPSKPAWGTVSKDGAEAWQYYGHAPNGEKARQELKEWTIKAAGEGNEQARAWLRAME